MSRKALNQTQFGGTPPMFLPASEIKNYVTSSVDLDNEVNNMEDLWEGKTEEAQAEYHRYWHGSGLYDSIKENGYDWSKPVEIWHENVGPDANIGSKDNPFMVHTGEHRRTMGEGHHRVAAGAQLEKETGKTVWIPILHKEDR